MKRIEHIGIAVKDLEAANEVYTKLFGKAPYKTETVESENEEVTADRARRPQGGRIRGGGSVP